MIFNVSEERNMAYKSFINPGANISIGVESKKTGGLDFLLKYKKEQEERKEREANNLHSVSGKKQESLNKNIPNPS